MAIMVILLSLGAAASVHWGRAAKLKNASQQVLASVQNCRQWALTRSSATDFIPFNDPFDNRGAYSISNSINGNIGTIHYLPAGIVWTNHPAFITFQPDGAADGAADHELIISESRPNNYLSHTVRVYRITGHAILLP